MKLTAELNGVPRSIRRWEELQAVFEDVKSHDPATLFLRQETERMKGWERFVYKILGLATDGVRLVAYLLRRGDLAALVFVDEDGHELRPTDERAPSESQPILFDLGNGESSTHEARECLPLATALEALGEFCRSQKPPSWISFRPVE